MTIKEYREQFLALFEQMEKEHGHVKYIEISHKYTLHDTIGNEYESNDCDITFS